ncbi:hypothetical protein ES702_04462 [subsurface metagenome]
MKKENKCKVCGRDLTNVKASFYYYNETVCSHWERELTDKEIKEILEGLSTT